MELCEGKEGMLNKPFHVLLGGTAACTVRLAQATSQSYVDNRTELVMGDSWFGSVKSVISTKKLCQDPKECIFQVKTAHSLFPKAFIEDVLKSQPGGTSISLRGELDGVGMIAIGYKYNKSRVLHFIMSENAGSTCDGEPYQMKFPDEHGNIHIREVPRPAVISEYFAACNSVDVHNQLRQYALKLEKKWVTTDPYFRLHTTITGINVVDCFQLATFHDLIGKQVFLYDDFEVDEEKNVCAIKRFGGVLARQLLIKAEFLDKEMNFRVEDTRDKRRKSVFPDDGLMSSQDTNIMMEDEEEEGGTFMSGCSSAGGGGANVEGRGRSNTFNDELDMEASMSQTEKVAPPKDKSNILCTFVDRLGKIHQAEKYPMKVQPNGKRYTFATRCSAEGCKKNTRVFCNGCNKPFCFSLSKGEGKADRNECFLSHFRNVKRKNKRRKAD
jgi:hypothetical protein